MVNDKSGTLLHDRYELESLIARGGMAEVYVALDTQLNRRVAVKILFPEYAREQSFVERFRREAQSAANLNHPNIVAIYDWGESDGTYFIVMEYVHGQSLRELLKENGPLDSDDIAEYATDIASALAYAHQNGVVHRDVKPANVLITNTGKVKVTDFGIARAGTSESLTQTGSVMGTATYFSPEQAQGFNVDGRSDIYSLGIVMYELATGAVPFSADTPIAVAFKHVSEKLVPPSVRNPDIAQDLEAIICKCLEKDPDRRYPNANDVHDDCIHFLRRRPISLDASQRDDATVMNAALIDVPDDMGRTQAVPQVRASTTTTQEPSRRPANDAYAFSAPPRKGPVAAVIALIILLLVGVGAAVAVSIFSDKDTGGMVEVPSVIGLTKDEARKKLGDLGLDVKIENSVNESVEAGKVYAQDPGEGVKIRKGNSVTLNVSVGIGESKVPDVKGMSLQDASLELEDAGFTVIPKEEPSESVEKDKAIRTNPKIGTTQKRGTSVEVYISLGPAQKTVPNVVGLDSTTAAAQLGQDDFNVVTQQEPSDTVAIGKVTRTDPPANTLVDREATITIYVSSGPDMVAVPNVKGMKKSEAISTLQNAVGGPVTITGTSPDEDPIVTNQSPLSPTKVKRGSNVTITVGS